MIKIDKKYTPYLLLAPAALYYIFFWLRPILSAFFEAFTDLEGNLSLSNFIRIFSEDSFSVAFKNTVVFVVVSVIVQYLLALALAFILNKKFRGSQAMLFIAMIPMAIPPLAVTILWKTGFTTFGWVNAILYNFGWITEPKSWLTVEGMDAIFFLIGIDTWVVVPGTMIIILAGLQNLNPEFSEAAKVYGASKFRTAMDIVIPIIKPTIVTSILLRIIASIQVWLISVTMFGYGRSPFLVERIAYFTEEVPLLPHSQKNAYAYSILVTFIVLVTAVVYLKMSRRGVKGAR